MARYHVEIQGQTGNPVHRLGHAWSGVTSAAAKTWEAKVDVEMEQGEYAGQDVDNFRVIISNELSANKEGHIPTYISLKFRVDPVTGNLLDIVSRYE